MCARENPNRTGIHRKRFDTNKGFNRAGHTGAITIVPLACVAPHFVSGMCEVQGFATDCDTGEQRQRGPSRKEQAKGL